MKLKIISPVAHESDGYQKSAIEALAPLLRAGTELCFAGLEHGFPSIESDLHALFNGPAIVRLAHEAYHDGFDGVFVNCFDDPGVYACRESIPIPVLGAYQPSIATALLTGERIGIITTDAAGILSEERKARLAGVSERVVAIRPVDMGVLELRDGPDALLARLTEACQSIWREERLDAAVLGCTGMMEVAFELRDRLKAVGCPLTVIEPFTAGVCQLETLVTLGMSNTLNIGITLDNYC